MDISGKMIIDIVIFFLNSVGKTVTRARQNNCVLITLLFSTDAYAKERVSNM